MNLVDRRAPRGAFHPTVTITHPTAAVMATLAEWWIDYTDGMVKHKPRSIREMAEWINMGDCGSFAEDLENLMPELIRWWNDCEELPAPPNPRLATDGWNTHCFVQDPGTGLYYDAEAPEGVERWWELPFFNRLDPEAP